MRKKLYVFLFAVPICLLIIFLFLDWYNARIYRSQLPALPAFTNMSKPLIQQITDADQNARSHPNADNIGRLGMVYHSCVQNEKAIICYQLAAKEDMKSWIWNYYIGYIYLETGENQRAIDFFEEVLKVNHNATMVLYYKGLAHQSLNATDKAEKILAEVAGMDFRSFTLTNTSRSSYLPVPLYARLQLASIYQNTHRTEMAERELKEIIRSEITFGSAYRQLSSLYSSRGDSTQSRYYSARAGDLTPFIPPADTLIDKLALISRSDEFLMKQIDLAIKSANSKWANDLLISGLKYFPDNKFYISKAVKQFLSTGMYQQALPLLDSHLRFVGDNYNELVLVGIQLANAGFKTQAGKYFSKAESIKQDEPEIRSSLALLLLEKLGAKDHAVNLMNEVLEKNPANVKVMIHAAFLFFQLNERSRGNQLLSRLKQMDPLNPKVISLEGVVAEQSGDNEKAIRFLERSFDIDAKDRYVVDHLGAIYLREKRWNRAIVFFRQALHRFPNYSSLQVNLGGLLVNCPDESLRNIREGIEYSERAFINYDYTFPIRISAGRNLAIAYDRLGNRERANYYMNSTFDYARKSHVSKDFIKNLEDLKNEFSSKSAL